MMTFYSLILIASVLLASGTLAGLFRSIAQHAGFSEHYAQCGPLVTILGFLMVVSLPAGVLIAALVMAVAMIAHPTLGERPSFAWYGLVLLAALVALIGVEETTVLHESIPAVAFAAGAVMVVVAVVLVDRPASLSMEHFALSMMVGFMPMALAPLFFSQAHASVALDGALVIAGLWAALWRLRQQPSAAFLRLPLAIVLAYAATQTVRYGAWPCAIAGLAAWGVTTLALSRRSHG